MKFIVKNRNSLGETFNLNVTTSYGKNVFIYMAIRTWNDVQKQIKGVILHIFSLVKLKPLLIEFYLNTYKKF